jgi:hypothetical protein
MPVYAVYGTSLTFSHGSVSCPLVCRGLFPWSHARVNLTPIESSVHRFFDQRKQNFARDGERYLSPGEML